MAQSEHGGSTFLILMMVRAIYRHISKKMVWPDETKFQGSIDRGDFIEVRGSLKIQKR